MIKVFVKKIFDKPPTGVQKYHIAEEIVQYLNSIGVFADVSVRVNTEQDSTEPTPDIWEMIRQKEQQIQQSNDQP